MKSKQYLYIYKDFNIDEFQMVQALLSYQERLREILISKLGWGQHDVIRTFPYSLPLCQLSARPLPGQLTTSAAGMDEKPSQKYIKTPPPFFFSFLFGRKYF